jgi:short-subunit dehydrogenase
MSPQPKLSLQGAVAVVTGAGGGIGSALALNLARRGCHLALTDCKPDLLSQSAAAARACGVTVSEHVFDIADAAAIAAFPEAVKAQHGRTTVLVNNAGVALAGSFEQVTLDEFEWLFNINFWGAVRMMKAFLPMLIAEPEAQIVNISSIFGLVGTPGQAAYAASKFAMRGVSESIRFELRSEGKHVGITVVHPAGVRTAIARNTRISEGMPKEHVNVEAAERLLTDPPEQTAELIVNALIHRKSRVLCGKLAILADLVQRITPSHFDDVFRMALGGGRRKRPE